MWICYFLLHTLTPLSRNQCKTLSILSLENRDQVLFFSKSQFAVQQPLALYWNESVQSLNLMTSSHLSTPLKKGKLNSTVEGKSGCFTYLIRLYHFIL